MAINYQVVGCTNPAGQQGVDYACDRETKTGTIDIDQLAAQIAHGTSITPTDVKGILSAYIFEIGNLVAEGNQVRIEGFGTFKPRIKSRCFRQTAIQAEGFNPAGYITGKSVGFTVDASFKREIREQASFTRVSSELMA